MTSDSSSVAVLEMLLISLGRAVESDLNAEMKYRIICRRTFQPKDKILGLEGWIFVNL